MSVTNQQKTHWKKLMETKYIGAYTLQPGQEIILTIKDIKTESVVGVGGKKEKKPVCYFQEKSLPMVMNATNLKTIANIYQSNFIEDWPGKKIQIYSELVDAFGDKVDALRIRPFPPNDLPELKEGTTAFTNAQIHMKEGGSIDNIEKRYRISQDIKNKLLGQC